MLYTDCLNSKSKLIICKVEGHRDGHGSGPLSSVEEQREESTCPSRTPLILIYERYCRHVCIIVGQR